MAATITYASNRVTISGAILRLGLALESVGISIGNALFPAAVG
jgi:cyanate permease